MKRKELLVFAAAFAAFSPSLFYGLTGWDDVEMIRFQGNVFQTFHFGAYIPLTLLSLKLGAHHLINLLLHAFNGVLVYRLALRLLKDERAALAAALLFAVHPLRAESVAWVAERKDVLSGAFYLLTVELYLEKRLEPALACFFFGLLSKASGIGLPVVLWLLARRKDVWPFFALSLAAGLAGMAGQRAASLGLSWGERLSLSIYGLAFYVRKTLLPFGLGPLYELSRPVALHWLSLLLCAGFFFLPRTVALSYLALIFPMLGLVQFGRQMAADRYSYLATLPFAFLLARWRPSLYLVPALFVLSLRQTAYWKDAETMWRRSLEVWPASAMAHANLSAVLEGEEALRHADAAVALDPGLWSAHGNRGAALWNLGRREEAVAELKRAYELEPTPYLRRKLELSSAELLRRPSR